MTTVAENSTISLSFIGKLDNGHVFMEVSPEKPMRVRVGDSDLPPTVEMVIIGMQQGETKKVRVAPDEGYGPRLKDLLHEVPKQSFPEHITPKPGMILSQKVETDGVEKQVPATVIELKENTVVIDYNHPLAGHHLTYELTVLSIDNN